MTLRTARFLPCHSGPAAWSSILGDQTSANPLGTDITADLVIVGGGFAGLSAARRVLQLEPDTRVVLLEAGLIAQGAAGRNSGFMIDLPHELTSDDYAGAGDDVALIELNRRAIAFGREAVGEYGIKVDYFDPVGKVNGAVGDAGHEHNISYAKHLKALGESCEILDEKEMLELTGSRYYRSGLYTPGTVMLQPAGYVREFADGLRHSVALHENSPVLGFEKQGGSWRVQTHNGSVATPRILLANNGHLESFGYAQGRLMQIFLFASMTRELTEQEQQVLGGAPRWGITPSDPMGTTMRRIDAGQGGHRIITRTCAKFCPNMQTSSADMARASKVHRKKFDDRFPQLRSVDMEFSWAGHLCLSRNGVAVTKEVDDGVFAACVQNGLGTTRGTLTGIAAAEMACGHSSEITRHFLAEEEPIRLPPTPLASLGANAYLRFKEWRAGAE